MKEDRVPKSRFPAKTNLPPRNKTTAIATKEIHSKVAELAES